MKREERKRQRPWRGFAAAAFFVVLVLQQIAIAPAARAEQAPRFFRIGTAATTGTY